MARPSALSKHSIEDLHAEIERRQRAVGPLEVRRQKLLAQVAVLDAEIGAAGGTPSRSAMSDKPERPRASIRRRAVNEVSLPAALHAAMKGKTLTVGEAADAVAAAGYKSFSRNFKVMVNMILTKHPKLFKRVARGQYTAR